LETDEKCSAVLSDYPQDRCTAEVILTIAQQPIIYSTQDLKINIIVFAGNTYSSGYNTQFPEY